MTRKVDISLNRKYAKPAFGTIDLVAEYYMSTIGDDGYSKNIYLVKCEIGGLENTSPVLNVRSAELVEFQDETNQDTLIESAIIQLFEDNI
jgi:hypothetical protein